MPSLYTQQDRNVFKTWLYLAAFLAFIVAIGWIMSYFNGSPAILYIAIIFSVSMSFGSYWWSDKLVLAMTKAKPIKKEDNPELYRVVENLCITAGLPLPKIYILNESQPNAFAAGRDANHAIVAVTRGLLEKLDKSELEGVISHELSHIGNRDILLSTIIVMLVGLVAIATNFFFRLSYFGGGFGRRDSRDENSQARGILMLVSLVLMVLAPLIATLMQLAISRKREFLADASGALLTRYPEGLARALEKISSDQNILRSANNATAHLFIADPHREKESASWFHKLFLTHPPVKDRIRALREMSI